MNQLAGLSQKNHFYFFPFYCKFHPNFTRYFFTETYHRVLIQAFQELQGNCQEQLDILSSWLEAGGARGWHARGQGQLKQQGKRDQQTGQQQQAQLCTYFQF